MELKMKHLRFVENFRRNGLLRKWAIVVVGLAGSVGVAVVSAVGPTITPSVSTTAPTTQSTTGQATTAPASTSTKTADTNRNFGRDSSYGRGRNGRRENSQPTGGSSVVVNANDPYAMPPTSSIFLKGNQELVTFTRPEPRPAPVPTYGFGGGKDTNLVFNGVTIVDDKPAAFVEDLSTNVVGIVKPGDAVAGGTVTTITFHDLEYSVRGQAKHVSIGQDFSGNAAVTASVGTITAMPTTAPTNNGGVQIIGNGASIPNPATAGGTQWDVVTGYSGAHESQERAGSEADEFTLI